MLSATLAGSGMVGSIPSKGDGDSRFIPETDVRHDFGLVHTYRTPFLTTPSCFPSAASATGQGGCGMNRCGRFGEEVSDLQSVPY